MAVSSCCPWLRCWPLPTIASTHYGQAGEGGGGSRGPPSCRRLGRGGGRRVVGERQAIELGAHARSGNAGDNEDLRGREVSRCHPFPHLVHRRGQLLLPGQVVAPLRRRRQVLPAAAGHKVGRHRRQRHRSPPGGPSGMTHMGGPRAAGPRAAAPPCRRGRTAGALGWAGRQQAALPVQGRRV